MRKNMLKIILFVSIFFSNISILDATEPTKENIVRKDPIQFLHSITEQVLTQLKHHRDTGNHKIDKEIYKIVDNLILPNVDFDEMGKWIAGRTQWGKASDADRAEFIHELKKLLTKTYSSTLNNYTEEKIEFQNYNNDRNVKRVQIKSTVIRPNKDNLAVDYRLIAAEENSWKVYDVIIEGVSILQGFQAQFSDDIRMHGLKFVSAKIRNHNNQNVDEKK